MPRKEKIAVICAKGLDSFIDSIIDGLAEDYWVRRIIITNQKEITDAIDWADIVWFEWCNEVAIIGTRYQGARKKKVIIRLHSYEALSALPTQVTWQNVDRLIFVAPHIREILKETIPDIGEKAKTEIVYNGLDIDKIPFKEREPGDNIAWVGYINYKKNPPMALQIMNKLVKINSRYKLHIAGVSQDMRYDVYLKHMAKEMGLSKNIIFHGWLQDMEPFWEDKNYLLHTSIHEGHSLAIMEAMARGIKPVIHNFRGAAQLYPRCCLFDGVDYAVANIRGLYDSTVVDERGGCSMEYDSVACRDWIIFKEWTIDNQIKQIKEIIEEL